MTPTQNAGMEVLFTFSREDYLHFVEFWARRNRRTQLRRTVRVFCLFCAAYVALFLLCQMPTTLAVGLGALLAMICTGLVHWTQRRRMQRVQERSLGERTTRIGPEGVFGRFSHFEILNYWKGITEIAEDENYLFFFTGGVNAHVVPKRAFATADGLAQFRDAANSHWKASHS